MATGQKSLSLTAAGDLELDTDGQIVVDETVATRCRIRLTTRRGEYWADPTLGSRFHELRLLKAARATAPVYAREALQPLLDAGDILDVEVGKVELDHETGFLGVPVTITDPEEQEIALGLFALGRV